MPFRIILLLALALLTAGCGHRPAEAQDWRGWPGLVAFWDFQEPAGSPRVSGPYRLREKAGRVERVEGGVFGPYAARLRYGQWFQVDRAELGRLDIHGPKAEVTVVAWIWREDRRPWQAIAGVWDETRGRRQYCLFLNAPRGTDAVEMKRHPLADRLHGHVSAVGGPTPGEQFCITYSSSATPVPYGSWQCVALRYDARDSRVYLDGRLDSLARYNPFPYAEGLYDGGADGAPFTVGAVHRSGSWGNFFGGRIGGLAVFDRALSEEEIARLAEQTKPLAR
jgi:hypothetical protein